MTNRFLNKLLNFGPLKHDEIAAIISATAEARSVPARQDLIREGDRPGPVFVMLDGWACRYKILPNGTRQILAYLMPGDSCDLHTALLTEMDHSIATVTPAMVATIDREQMDAMMDKHRGIAKALYMSQLIDEGTMRAWITSMGRRSSIERAAHLMCELYLRAHNIGLAPATTFELPLPQTMLADSLGMTNVHLNRVLRDLRNSGAVTLTRRSLMIDDVALLAKIAGFDENYLHRRSRPAA